MAKCTLLEKEIHLLLWWRHLQGSRGLTAKKALENADIRNLCRSIEVYDSKMLGDLLRRISDVPTECGVFRRHGKASGGATIWVVSN